MVDFHSHVLPAVDDGSRDVAESIALLTDLAKQGVKTVVATPHFYANRHSVNRFLEKRQTAYEKLIAEKLKSTLGIGVKVHLVNPKTITRSEGKAKRVIDNRKLH